MELLASGLNDVQVFQDEHNGFYEYVDWEGVETNADGNVISIDWNSEVVVTPFAGEYQSPVGQGGSIDLRWLPATVLQCSIADLGLHGTLETCRLPTNIVRLEVDNNEMNGTFSIEGLPLTVAYVFLSENNFDGSLNVQDLPKCMELFCVWLNRFSGSLILSNLPDSLLYMDVSENLFSGEIDLRKIPPRIHTLSLHSNNFRQDELVVGNIPETTEKLYVDPDRFGCIVDLEGREPELTRTRDVLSIGRRKSS